MVKNPPANARDSGDSDLIMDQKDPLEQGMITLSSILAWELSWTEEPGRLQCMGLQNQT